MSVHYKLNTHTCEISELFTFWQDAREIVIGGYGTLFFHVEKKVGDVVFELNVYSTGGS